MNVNLVVFAGRVTRDPSMKYLPNQMALTEFGLVSNRTKIDKSTGEKKEIPTFIDCAAFGKTGEAINNHFKKGKEIYVEGSLKFDSWDDKNGGGKRSKLSLVVNSFQFVGGRGDDSGVGAPIKPATKPTAKESDSNFDESDIPF